MHRSGTSLAARILGDLGWYLGRPDELLGPREDNPDGFFERADVQVLNDRILSQVGASWDGPPAPEEVCNLVDDEVDQQLAALITTIREGAGAGPFALKDPRLCVLWPLWERHLPPTTRLVLTFRHPGEVATSLQKRDGLPIVTGLALWEDYVRRALAAAKEKCAVVVRYGDLLERPDESIESLAEALGTTVPSGWTQAVRPELYRNRTPHDVSLSTSQRELWSWIEQAPRSVDRLDPDTVPGRQSESSIELVRSRRHFVTLQAEVERLRGSLKEAESELKEEKERQSAVDRTLRDARDTNARAVRAATIEIAVLRDRVRHHQTVQARQEAQLERDSAHVIRLAEERELLDQHVEALRQRRLEQRQHIEALRLENDEAQAALAEKESQVRVARLREQVLVYQREQLLRAVSVVEDQRRAQEAAVRAMRNSRTWRWGRKFVGPLAGAPRGEQA